MSSVLIVGGGGREHALAWRMSKSEKVKQVYVTPGNGADFPNPGLNINNADEIVEFCRTNSVDLIVVGPEVPLSQGIVDSVNGRVRVFGPGKDGAMLESSKIFSKKFMKENGLPTADFAEFNKIEDAESFINSCNWSGIVVKADGLAAGKGVVVAGNKEEAKHATRSMLEGEFGASSSQILLEEKLSGYEVSALCFTDGKSFKRMPLIRDHKRLLEDDQGPNTGGMGVVGPVTVPHTIDSQIDEILQKTVDALQKKGIKYTGVIYAGIMVTSTGPQLLEFNCRFGDPETEILMRLLDSDLYDICTACVDGNLRSVNIDWKTKFACGIILSSKEYPYKSDKGTPITHIPEDNADVITFHAGTAKVDGKLVTNGGRILCVTGLGNSPKEARLMTTEIASKVEFEGKFYRKDIGLKYENSTSVSMTYGDSGVDIEEGNAFVEGIKNLVKATLKPGTSQIGGFGAVVDFASAGFSGNSQIVVGIDGVGTKIEIASELNDFSSIGFDVVGMCVNDVLCHCAQPIAFLDYFVCGKLNRNMATEVVKSISEACIESGCSLIGGETAEMPGVYGPSQWDLAGCAIAARETNWPELPNIKGMVPGDILIGLHSSGVHSNGFSLVRKICSVNGVKYTAKTPWDEKKTFGQCLLAPTRLYVKQVLPLLREGLVKGCAHITGGGIEENSIRVLDKNGDLALEIDASSWGKLPLYNWLATMGPVSDKEMLRAFNCGIGMVLVVSTDQADAVLSRLTASGERPVKLGNVIKKSGDHLIQFKNLEKAFDRETFKTEQRRRIKVGILISGTGSNMKKLIEKAQKSTSNCEVALVISNKPNVKGLEVAESLDVRTLVIPHSKVREEGDAKVSEALNAAGVELVCLAGYMRILSPEFIRKWNQRIINIHPALLPSFKGAHAVSDAISFGARVTGCTVHYVDEEVDHGAIVAQSAVVIDEGETEETLHKKIQQKEHELFPEAMETVARKMIEMQK